MTAFSSLLDVVKGLPSCADGVGLLAALHLAAGDWSPDLDAFPVRDVVLGDPAEGRPDALDAVSMVLSTAADSDLSLLWRRRMAAAGEEAQVSVWASEVTCPEDACGPAGVLLVAVRPLSEDRRQAEECTVDLFGLYTAYCSGGLMCLWWDSGLVWEAPWVADVPEGLVGSLRRLSALSTARP